MNTDRIQNKRRHAASDAILRDVYSRRYFCQMDVFKLTDDVSLSVFVANPAFSEYFYKNYLQYVKYTTWCTIIHLVKG